MVVINKKEKEKVKSINFHDAEIEKIICDYNAGIVEIPIIMDDTHQYAALLKFENIFYMEVNHKEPWGPGINIITVNVDDADGDYFKVSILLSSGDEVNIIASKMIYTSSE